MIKNFIIKIKKLEKIKSFLKYFRLNKIKMFKLNKNK